MKYDHASIEKKWQARWQADAAFATPKKPGKKKLYLLDMFPYPSAAGLHVGHPLGYTATDILARKRRMEGWSVLHPMGWDAFGLPTENYAIKVGKNPKEVAAANIENFRRQIQALGFSYDWTREVNTADPSYYKWTQWLFLKLHERGLVYKAKAPVNWCPKDQTVLANEQVVNGNCERCGTAVEQKELAQWFFKITAYADRLLTGLEHIEWPEKIKTMQKNWIGKSEGAKVSFTLVDVPGQDDGKHSITVFTTRPDTLFGVTFLVISPERAKLWLDIGWQATDEVRAYVAAALNHSAIDRADATKEKTGVATGVSAIHPVTGNKIPVWVSDYVLGNVGTGSIMAVPAHDERDFAFAEKFRLPVKKVVVPPAMSLPVLNAVPSTQQTEVRVEAECFVGDGENINSDFLDGLPTWKAKDDMISWLEENKKGERAVTYRLRDWLVSRQRYWGAPIPMILCETCGEVPMPEKELPVTLPDDVDFRPTGESPLARSESFHRVTCPKCGATARRESDTMDTFVDSSWYFLRYCSPNDAKQPFDAKEVKAWCPVDVYVGGAEHAVLHLLYARFISYVLHDAKLLPFEEPFTQLRNQGLILAEDGQKMSKSRGNVVNPDEVVAEFGADALRLYEMFMGPFEDAKPWNTKSMVGIRRFLERLATISEQVAETGDADVHRLTHETVAKVSADIESFKFNTAIAQMMILANAMGAAPAVARSDWEMFLCVVAPFAPHLTDELWERLGNTASVSTADWPEADPTLLVRDTMKIVIQVNGKVRDTLVLPASSDKAALEAAALASPRVQEWLAGQPPKNVVVVAGRLVNIVTQETSEG